MVLTPLTTQQSGIPPASSILATLGCKVRIPQAVPLVDQLRKSKHARDATKSMHKQPVALTAHTNDAVSTLLDEAEQTSTSRQITQTARSHHLKHLEQYRDAHLRRADTIVTFREGQTMNRRIAVVGDSLSSGGTISPYSGPPFLVHRHQAALIGGSAFCVACQSTGIIAKAGGPYRLKFQGEVALDRDIVLCGCSTPPSITALLAGEAWCDDGLKGLGEVISSRTITGPVVSIKKGAFDEQVEAKTSGSAAQGPEGYPYWRYPEFRV